MQIIEIATLFFESLMKIRKPLFKVFATMFRSLKVLRLLGLKVKQTVFQLIEAKARLKFGLF